MEKPGGSPIRYAHLPQALRAAAHFSDRVQHLPVTGYSRARRAGAVFRTERQGDAHGNDVTLEMDAPGNGVTLLLPRQVQLRSLTIAGIRAPAAGQVDTIICATPDCGRMRMTLHLDTSAPFEIVLRSVQRGLPPHGKALLQARPPEAVPSRR